MIEKMQVTYKNIEDLIPYARNSRTHSDKQIAQIAASIKEFGWRNPVLIDGDNGIIAGHGRVLAARKLNIEQIPTIDGSDMTDIQKRMYVIADNKLALNADWDDEILALELEELESLGADIELLGFDDEELDDLNGDDEGDGDEPYTNKVEAPIYEPSENEPKIDELFDDTKTLDLITRIEQSSAPAKVKDFLKLAAHRHTVFNYKYIADYYSHADEGIQKLFEDSALVIIDFNRAVEEGYVKLAAGLFDKYSELIDDNEAH
jgi:hypothetical protein